MSPELIAKLVAGDIVQLSRGRFIRDQWHGVYVTFARVFPGGGGADGLFKKMYGNIGEDWVDSDGEFTLSYSNLTDFILRDGVRIGPE